MNQKVSKMDWIVVAARFLAEKSVDAVKVEVLARELKVSKGSFYWYFKNRGALLEAVLAYWEAETDGLVELANEEVEPIAKMRRLFEEIGVLAEQYGGFNLDIGIFRWSQRDAEIAERVRAVEDKRIGFIQEIMVELGIQQPQKRAELMYLAFLGFADRASRYAHLRSQAEIEELGRDLLNTFLKTEEQS